MTPVSSPTPDEQAAEGYESGPEIYTHPKLRVPTKQERAAWAWAEDFKQQRDLLAQSMWEARRILGFDNDSDETPAATIAGSGYEGFARMHEREAAQARQDYDELCDESDGYEKGAAASEAALVVVREQLTRVEALLDEKERVWDNHVAGSWLKTSDVRAALDVKP